MEGAKAALQIKKTTYNQIYDVANAKRGHLSIGLTPGRGLRMFTAIYPELHRSYPNLEVKPIEMRVRAQQTAIAKGEIDVGFITLHEKDRTNDVYVNLEMCIRDRHRISEIAKIPIRVGSVSKPAIRFAEPKVKRAVPSMGAMPIKVNIRPKDVYKRQAGCTPQAPP